MKVIKKGATLIIVLIIASVMSIILVTFTEYVIYRKNSINLYSNKIDKNILLNRLISKEKEQYKKLSTYFNYSKKTKKHLIYSENNDKSIGGYTIHKIKYNNDYIDITYNKEILGLNIRVKENLVFNKNMPYTKDIKILGENE